MKERIYIEAAIPDGGIAASASSLRTLKCTVPTRPVVLLGLLMFVPLSAQVRSENSVPMPKDLVSIVRSDLGVFGPEESCLHQQHLRFEQALSTSWTTLNEVRHSAVVVRGLGPCFAGAHNGPFLIYARIGHGWRKILAVTGARLERLNSVTKGWNDLEFWFNQSGARSLRYIYRFNGFEYIQAGCDVAEYNDPITHEPAREPTYRPCPAESEKP